MQRYQGLQLVRKQCAVNDTPSVFVSSLGVMDCLQPVGEGTSAKAAFISGSHSADRTQPTVVARIRFTHVLGKPSVGFKGPIAGNTWEHRHHPEGDIDNYQHQDINRHGAEHYHGHQRIHNPMVQSYESSKSDEY